MADEYRFYAAQVTCPACHGRSNGCSFCNDLDWVPNHVAMAYEAWKRSEELTDRLSNSGD